MRATVYTTCAAPGCDTRVTSGRCTPCTPPDRRPSASARGYGPTWRTGTRDPFLQANPTCVDCGEPSEIPDHDPYTRRELVALGVADPDDWRYLKARCRSHANRRAGAGR